MMCLSCISTRSRDSRGPHQTERPPSALVTKKGRQQAFSITLNSFCCLTIFPPPRLNLQFLLLKSPEPLPFLVSGRFEMIREGCSQINTAQK